VQQTECETECGKYSWCKGIRISTGGSCRLLASLAPPPITGWNFYDLGNWVEPDEWKNGGASSYTCRAKKPTGVYLTIRFLFKALAKLKNC
jgi:hypothetical protein